LLQPASRAYSMGNHGHCECFGQVFLAAPDVDARLFQNLSAAYTRLSTRTTHYVTTNDKAIGLSRWWHQLRHPSPRSANLIDQGLRIGRRLITAPGDVLIGARQNQLVAVDAALLGVEIEHAERHATSLGGRD